MASSPSHLFGELIGSFFEEMTVLLIDEAISTIKTKYDLYLDYHHPRAARCGKPDIRMVDSNGNTHRLDIVIEKGGTENQFGLPRAFVEVAWRRYSKHAKNKVQEISGAIKPIVANLIFNSPFYGAVLAGDFTDNSLNQLKSEGFSVFFIPTRVFEKAFSEIGVDIHWEESTPDDHFLKWIEKIEKCNESDKRKVLSYVTKELKVDWREFAESLKKSLTRCIEAITVNLLFGDKQTFVNVEEACSFLSKPANQTNSIAFVRCEIEIRYSNGDRTSLSFVSNRDAIAFLQAIK